MSKRNNNLKDLIGCYVRGALRGTLSKGDTIVEFYGISIAKWQVNKRWKVDEYSNLNGTLMIVVVVINDYLTTLKYSILHPKKKTTKKKLEVYKKSIEPIWDAELSFDDVVLEELRNRALEIIVHDEFEGKTGDILGRVCLGSGAKQEKWDTAEGREVQIWNMMLNHPGQWATMMIPLRQDIIEVEE